MIWRYDTKKKLKKKTKNSEPITKFEMIFLSIIFFLLGMIAGISLVKYLGYC